MSLPVIAIVGRPNVGKSSYLNAVAGRRVSIVEATPGVTRDRIAVEVEHADRVFELVDTGGIGVVDEMRLDEHIEQQIEVALRQADAIIFLVDGRDGIATLDQKVAQILRRLRKPVVLGVNKLDHPKFDDEAMEFYKLGLGDPNPVSAREKIGVFELLEQAVGLLPEPDEMPSEHADLPKFAFVGKRNVGKSTLLNALAGEERVIVSDIEGTTRDAVDVVVELPDGRKFVAIDTAGMMRARKINDSIQFYSQVRTEEAIERADVVLLLIDATSEVSRVDKKIEQVVQEQRKACVIVVNKWDLARETIKTGEYMEYLADRLPGLHFAPVVFMSALEKMNLTAAIDVAYDVSEQAKERVPTAELNKVIEAAFERRKPGGPKGYKARVFYGTQVAESPPTFAIFVNEPKLFPNHYKRYLENRLREAFDFEEIPLQIVFKRRVSLFHD